MQTRIEKRGLFEVIGGGEIGKKAEDLNAYSEIIKNAGMSVLEGMVIGTEVFEKLISFEDYFEGLAGNARNLGSCPDFMFYYNEKILDRMEIGWPYIVRSSAFSEKGGTGIYKSVFFWPTGDRKRDLWELWVSEVEVYLSEFTSDAKLWREKTGSPMGMAILVQPVAGKFSEKYFFPTVSGVAELSVDGKLTVRVVTGMGTLAVSGGGVVYDSLPYVPANFLKTFWNQEKLEAISFPSGEVFQVDIAGLDIKDKIFDSFSAFNSLFEKLEKLRSDGSFYLEWAIQDDEIFIVQCSKMESELSTVDLSFNEDGHFLLMKSSDVSGTGRVRGKTLVYATMWTESVIHGIEHLNMILKEYILVVPQHALFAIIHRLATMPRLSFRHFSNALAIVEKQVHYNQEERMLRIMADLPAMDHKNQGATHFAGLCKGANILFVGGEFDRDLLLDLPGKVYYKGDVGLAIWNVSVEVMTDSERKEGFVYISNDSKNNKYSLYQIQEWSDLLRDIANALNESEEFSIAGHFYTIHYAIGPSDDPTGYDPFDLDETIVAEDGIPKIIESLKIVIAKGDEAAMENGLTWEAGLKKYLEELLEHLEQKESLVS